MIQMTYDTDAQAIKVHTPYNAGFVAALKSAINTADRKWIKDERVWAVSLDCAQPVAELINQYYGQRVEIPTVNQVTELETVILDLRYLGRVKMRADGTESAFGWTEGGWNAIFPKATLHDWFGVSDRPGDAVSLYAALGVRHDAPQADIKKAYRRMAKMWHPDACFEQDAATQFQRIQHAYSILSEPTSRAKYNAGLAMEAAWRAMSPQEDEQPRYEWAAPLRCGFVLVNGRQMLGRTVIETILQWEDIKDADGRILVSSWPAGADHFMESWL